MPPLSAPEALAYLQMTRPSHPSKDKVTWARMTAFQRQHAGAEYARKLGQWEIDNDSRKKGVSWRLVLEELIPSADGRKLRMIARSRQGYRVLADIPDSQAAKLLAFDRYTPICLKGKLADYALGTDRRADPEDTSYVETFFWVRVAEAQIDRAPDETRVVFFGVPGSARCVVYVVDRSGSMVDRFDRVRHELLQSVQKLGARQWFHVIFYASGAPVESPPGKLSAPDESTVQALSLWLGKVRAQGHTEVLPALRRAVAVLSKSPPDATGRAIYLLTDGIFPDNDAVQTFLREQAKGVQIHTLLIGRRLPEAVEVLQAIARESGGTYKYVESE
jgi:hypothetical protein